VVSSPRTIAANVVIWTNEDCGNSLVHQPCKIPVGFSYKAKLNGRRGYGGGDIPVPDGNPNEK
jgi:hypothetical protein